MPLINRIRLANIGVSKIFMDNLILNCYGENTVMYLENGGGKSSIISLILSLLRPYSYAFLGNSSNRSLKEYVFQGLPAHIMIEWIFEDKKRTEFLLTGVVITKKNDDTIHQLFYTLKYPIEVRSHLTFDSIETENDSGFLGSSQFISMLRNKRKQNPSQEVKYYNNEIGKWVEHLNHNLIDSELIKAQLDMNKREGGQDSILDFQNDFDFIRFLIRNLSEINEDDKDLREIKEVYDNVKDLPKLEAQKEFIELLLNILEEGKPLEKETIEIEKEIVKSIKFWELLTSYIEDTILVLKNECDVKRTRLNQSEINLGQINQSIEETSKQLNYLKFRKNSVLIKEFDKRIRESNKTKKEFIQNRSYLEILPPFQDYKGKSALFHQYNERLSKESAPIIEELESLRQKTHYYCEKLKKEDEIVLNKHDKDHNANKELQNEKNQKLGGLKRERDISYKAVQESVKVIREITQEEEKIKSLLIKDQDLLASIVSYETCNEGIEEEISLEDEKLQKIETNLEEMKYQRAEKKEALNTKSNKISLLEEKQNIRLKAWQELTSVPSFSLFFGKEWINQNPNYDILQQEKLNQIENEIIKLDEKILRLAPLLIELEDKINHYEETGQLPSNKNTEGLLRFLKESNLGYWIGTGWEYLKLNYPSNEEKEAFSKKIPDLLDAIVVNLAELEELENYLKDNKELDELRSLTESICISSPNIFEKSHINQRNDNSIIFSPDSKFKYDEVELKELIDKFKENLSEYSTNLKRFKKQIDSYKNTTQKWKDFLEHYPFTEYDEIEKELLENEKEIESLSEKISLLELDIQENQTAKEKIIEGIKTFRAELKKNQITLKKLNKFRPSYEKKFELKQKIEREENIIEQKRLEIIDLEEEISNLKEQGEQILTAKTEISEKIKDIESKLRLLKTPYSEEIKVLKTDIVAFIEQNSYDTCWKLFHGLKSQYDHIVNESELKQQIINLEVEMDGMKEKLDLISNNLKISVEDQGFQEIFNENLDYAQILDKKKFIEKSLDEIKVLLLKDKEEKNKLSKENINFKKEISFSFEELEEYYKEIKQNKSAITEQLEQLQQDNENNKEKQNSLKSLIENLKIEIEKLITDSSSYKTLKNLTSSNLTKIISEKNPQEIEIIPELSLEINSLGDLNSLIEVEQKNLDDLLYRIKEKNKKIFGFIEKIKGLNEKKISNLEEIRLKEFIEDFNPNHIFQVSSFSNKMKKRLEQITELIKSPKERLFNIVKIYSSIVDDILTKIINLEKVKLPIPQISHLNNRQIIKIPINAHDEVSGTVENYFKELFDQHSHFPEDLSKTEIINNIIDNYLQIRMKPIKFLFPEKSQIVSYEPISKIIKSSGGEKLTLAIMLYCLIAHHRMKYLGIRKPNISYPLIMDDPIGTASRSDLISMQISLAKHLKIQLIPFTHVPDVEALHQYYNFVTLKRSISQKNKIQIEVQNEEPPQVVQGGFVRIRPKMVKHFQTMDQYLGEDNRQ